MTPSNNTNSFKSLLCEIDELIEETVAEKNTLQKQIDTKKNTKKKDLGQFYTTNYDYILKGLSIPDGISKIIEPFAGNKDLLSFIDVSQYKSIDLYDLDPKHPDIIKQDTLKNPPSYTDKFVITNPPYLAKNKADIKDKDIYTKYDESDLYTCFLKSLCMDKPIGGIMIIPLNFFCALDKLDIRKQFLNIFNIIKLNIFEEQVFDDTSYTVCAFQFECTKQVADIDTYVYPSKKNIKLSFCEENNYTIGYTELYKPVSNCKHEVSRLVAKKAKEDLNYITHISVYCIDTSVSKKIRFVYDENFSYVDETEKQSCRNIGTLVIKPAISKERQRVTVKQCNIYLNNLRDRCNSLCLTHYRESRDGFARKKFSYTQAFNLVKRVLTSDNSN